MKGVVLLSIVWYVLAAFAEIGGCFAFWVWLRQKQTPLVLIPGLLSLSFFAIALTRVDTEHAGRAFAAYGGVYILASLLWLWAVEGVRPDCWDMIGMAICLIGAGVIFFGPRS